MMTKNMVILNNIYYIISATLRKQKAFATIYLIIALGCELATLLLLLIYFNPAEHIISHPLLITTIALIGLTFSVVFMVICFIPTRDHLLNKQ